MQSADGSVMIPSFHRPAAIRIDSTVTPAIYDWGGPQNAAWENAAPGNWNDSASRILRPRAADGHDASAFPDLVPDATGKITYDVDNDGDGITDSVWVDLGYPARRNAQGQLYKPLFAFMVIGLNGRIPLNTAGNLAGQTGGIPFPWHYRPRVHLRRRRGHAPHLGNSVSEIDPTYALQNGFDLELRRRRRVQRSRPRSSLPPRNTPGRHRRHRRPADAAPQPAGRHARRRTNPGAPGPPAIAELRLRGDGDRQRRPDRRLAYFMPNGVADPQRRCHRDRRQRLRYVQRLTPPVAGRWGEADSISGGSCAALPNRSGDQRLREPGAGRLTPTRYGRATRTLSPTS